MKYYRAILLYILILDIIFIVSCSNADHKKEITSTPTTVNRIDPAQPLTVSTPSILSLTSTPKPIITPVQTKTLPVQPTITSTAIPTLSPTDAKQRLQFYFDNNGGCLLPCLWGITPGQSTLQDAKLILEPLRSISGFTHFGADRGTVFLHYTNDNLITDTNISVLTYPDNQTINRIAFDVRALKEMINEPGVLDIFDSEAFSNQVEQYMLQRILTTYGQPSSVMITTLAEPPPQERGGDIGYFRIILLYPDQGILVNYITNIQVVGENVVGCLANAHVKMELYPSGNGATFMKNLTPQWKEDIQNNYKPLEEVTNFTIDDFYKKFSLDSDQCLVTPANLWPVMER